MTGVQPSDVVSAFACATAALTYWFVLPSNVQDKPPPEAYARIQASTGLTIITSVAIGWFVRYSEILPVWKEKDSGMDNGRVLFVIPFLFVFGAFFIAFAATVTYCGLTFLSDRWRLFKAPQAKWVHPFQLGCVPVVILVLPFR